MGWLERLRGSFRRAPAPRLESAGKTFLSGRCNVCGLGTRFLYDDPALHRESLVCVHCLTTSRYRSMARGLLKAFDELAGVRAGSLEELPRGRRRRGLALYDTQVAFDAGGSAYPVPTLLSRCRWLDLSVSTWKPALPAGQVLAPAVTNQNLERLTFPDARFDVVLTSDVLEHVRLEARAHREIRRVLKPGGVYVFTVPHFRDRPTIERVRIRDEGDPSRDEDVLPREYHGDANSEEGRALAYRSFGIDLDEKLRRLGFEVDYEKRDFPELGILNTELFFCRVVGPAAP
ncbi:MAG TPA: class I SAM-dependent methyltransferase [Thermoanaerobaculia bacterium]|nr:class I SAM-dependent methyltransferase [Thermoanaerobaculia bacterium]